MNEPSGIFEPSPGGSARRLARTLRTHRPVVAGGAVVLIGYVVMAALLVGLGFLLTKLLLKGSLGSWDDSATRWFVAHRTPTLNRVSSVGSTFGATLTVIGVAVAVAIVLAIGRHWRQLGFLVAALVIEATVAYTSSTIVNRPRPHVLKLGAEPPTASFPSGHTAAAVVLYVSLALVLASFVRSAPVRALAWIFAIAIPIFVGLSRIYRGVHHPTDVIGSVVLGAGCLMFAMLAVRTGASSREDRGAHP